VIRFCFSYLWTVLSLLSVTCLYSIQDDSPFYSSTRYEELPRRTVQRNTRIPFWYHSYPYWWLQKYWYYAFHSFLWISYVLVNTDIMKMSNSYKVYQISFSAIPVPLLPKSFKFLMHFVYANFRVSMDGRCRFVPFGLLQSLWSRSIWFTCNFSLIIYSLINIHKYTNEL